MKFQSTKFQSTKFQTMKLSGNHHSPTTRWGGIAAMLLIVFSSNYVFGQIARSAERATNPNISIDFPGGTIDEYVDEIKQQASSLNLIVTETAKDLKLPKIALKNVPVKVAIQCIEHCFNMSDGQTVRVNSDNESVTMITAQITKHRSVDVINIRHLIKTGEKDTENFLSAVDAGLKMMSDASKPDLKIQLHEETGLLFLSGEPQVIELVQRIVGEMEGSNFHGRGGMPGMGGLGGPSGGMSSGMSGSNLGSGMPGSGMPGSGMMPGGAYPGAAGGSSAGFGEGRRGGKKISGYQRSGGKRPAGGFGDGEFESGFEGPDTPEIGIPGPPDTPRSGKEPGRESSRETPAKLGKAGSGTGVSGFGSGGKSP